MKNLHSVRLDCTSNKTPEPNKIAYAPPSLVVVPWFFSSFKSVLSLKTSSKWGSAKKKVTQSHTRYFISCSSESKVFDEYIQDPLFPNTNRV